MKNFNSDSDINNIDKNLIRKGKGFKEQYDCKDNCHIKKCLNLSFIFTLLIVSIILIMLIIINSNYVLADVASTQEYYQHSDVLLICNPSSNDSIEICNYFLSKRPTLTHVLNLTGISTSESVSSSVYSSILNQTSYYLNHTNDTINYIVTTKGVPLTTGYSVTSLLAYDLRNTTLCPGYSSYVGEEETFSHSKYGFYITARLDGYDVQDVKNLIDISTLSNRDSNALTNGNFVLDEAPMYFPTYLLSTKNHLQTDLGYNVVYGNTSISPYFIRNATNVIGYYSWGSNDNQYWTSSNVLTNNGFSSWSSNNSSATNWSVISGAYYRGNAYSKTDLIEINTTGINSIYQDYVNSYAGTRRFVYYIGYGYNNFTGSVILNLTGLDSDNNSIVNFSRTLLSKTSVSNVSSITSDMTLKYFPNISASKIRVILIANITSGSFYIDYIQLNEIAPHNTWINGSIGTTAVSTSARSFAKTTSYGQSLIADLIKDGISGVEGFVAEPYLGAVADSYKLFDRYSKGYNLGDSFYMASDNLNWMDVIIGDPKTIIKTPGLSGSVSLVDLLTGERINNGTWINFSVSGNFNISNVSYTYTNGTSFGPFNLSIINNTVSVNTTNWIYGNYNVTLFLVSSIGDSDNKSFSFILNQTIGNTPKYSSFGGVTTDFKTVANRTGTTVVLEKTGAGKIDYGDTLLNVSGYDLDSYVIINSNNITIHSANVSSLNTSANVYLYAFSYQKTPLIYKNGIVCGSTGTLNCSLNYYNATTGELSFNVTSFSSYTTGVNANLSIWDDSDSGEKNINTNLRFYANYSMNVNNTAITNGQCSILFSDEVSGYGIFNSTSKLYEYTRNFSSGGSYDFTFYCNHSVYENLSLTDTSSISSCLRPTTSINWNISTAQTCENVVFTMPQNKSINIISGGNLTLINTTIKMNLSSNGLSGINVSGTGILDIQGSNITSVNNNYSFIVNGSYFSIINSYISNAGLNSNINSRGLEIHSNISNFRNNTLSKNYATVIYSNNNYLNNIITSGNVYGIWFSGTGNTLQDSVLGNDNYNVKSSDSSNILLNTTNSSNSLFDGSATRKWYLNIKITDGSGNAINGATVSLNGDSYTTANDGWIGQKNITQGSYTLTIQKTGYYSSTPSLNLNRSIISQTYSLSAIPSGNGDTSTGSSGGGGGGSSESFWKKVYDSSNSDILNLKDYSKEIGEKERIKILFKNEIHYIGVTKIINDKSAIIQIASSPINVTFFVGEEKKFDLDNDNDYDLMIQLNSILNNKTNLSISGILNEKSNAEKVSDSDKDKNESTETPLGKVNKLLIIIPSAIVITLIIAILGLFIFYIIKRISGKAMEKKVKKRRNKFGR